jgi:hypothetical protein
LDLWFVLLVLAVVVAITVRVAPDRHRYAVFVGGKYTGLKGPGLLFRMPAPATRWLRLRMGDRVEIVSMNLAKIGNFHAPVAVESGDAGAVMRIKAFQGGTIVIGAE